MILFFPRGNKLEKYKQGMKVVCTKACDGNEEIVGRQGFILNDEFKRPLVLFKDKVDGHDGFTKKRKFKSRCWLVDDKYLMVIAHEDLPGRRFWSVEKGKYVTHTEMYENEDLQREEEMAKSKRGLYEVILFDPKQQKVIEEKTVVADDEKDVLFEAGITKETLKEKGISKLRDVDVLITEKGRVRSDVTEVPVKLIMQAGKATLIKEEEEEKE